MQARSNPRCRLVIPDPIHSVDNLDPLRRTPAGYERARDRRTPFPKRDSEFDGSFSSARSSSGGSLVLVPQSVADQVAIMEGRAKRGVPNHLIGYPSEESDAGSHHNESESLD
jgi:hypothetical protein